MRAALAVLLVALAGCAGDAGGPAAQVDDASALPSLDAYASCPVVNGNPRDCMASEDSPYLVDVRSEVPPAWTCLTFGDQRFATWTGQPYPFPDLYTYYGPVIADGGPTGKMGLGLLYDAHGDAEAVAGAMVIDTEDDPRVFTWQGPATGFVQLPTPIESSEMRIYGVIYPAGPTQGTYDIQGLEPAFEWDSEPALDHTAFWSMGPFETQTGAVLESSLERQWNLVHNAELAGMALHLPAQSNGTTELGPSDGSGMAHWGGSRSRPFNTTVAADGLQVEASVQTYMEFYAEFHDLDDPSALFSSRFLCGCPDPVVANWVADPLMAVQCLAGVPLPVVQAGPTSVHVALG